ncbi:amidohydrolase family protein [Sphingomonas sp. DT-204]|uniref:amidohydrolase family protein n=1 Tax=Sphingomonas sp. DT-204 TaxID=3396166 RepID=UPI003F1B93D8
MPEIPFVDAHVHLWDLSRIRYPWLTPPFSDDGPNGSVEPIAKDYLLDDYLADASRWNVVGMVHVDAGAEPTAALAETEWLQAMRDERGMPSGIVAFAALDDPEVDTLLAAHAMHPGVRGIRHIVNWHPDPKRTYGPRDVTRDEAWERGYARLADHGFSFDLQCYPGQMEPLAGLIAHHPDIAVIVNHMGMAVATDPDGFGDWRRGMRALAANRHVVTKLSGAGFVHRPWTIDQIRPLILEAIEIFGAERCLFASDFPTDKLFGSFDRHMEAYHAIVADFTGDEKRALFGGNANRVYRLDLDL